MRTNKVDPISMKKSHKAFYEKLKGKHSLDHIKHVRLQILLLCHSGLSNSAVSRKLEVSLNTVRKWRSRWLSVYDRLLELEGTEEEDYLLSILKDKQRSGLPKQFSMAEEQAIVALACEKPREHGIEMTDWTLEMLCKVASAKGIVKSISTSQVSRLLKNTAVTTA